MNSPSQPGDRLREKLRQARQSTPPPAKRALEAGATDAEALVDKHAALPDPLALARMYQSSELRARLIDETEEEQEERRRPTGRDRLVAPAEGDDDRREDVLREGPTRPSMSPAEIRQVMAELQARFPASERSYETFELSSRPSDDVPMVSREEREAERAAAIEAYEAEATGGTWVYVVGGVLTVAVILLFIYLALYGPAPFRARPAPTPSPASTPVAAQT